jgi:hypothetical protein
MRSRQYRHWKQMATGCVSMLGSKGARTYNLELHGDHPKVQYLNGGPEHPVGLECVEEGVI